MKLSQKQSHLEEPAKSPSWLDTKLATKAFNPYEAKLHGKVLVEAGAGSGKTYSLITLFLRLLLEKKCKSTEIIVVTYTNAAAAEIRSRLLHSMLELRRLLEFWPNLKVFRKASFSENKPSLAKYLHSFIEKKLTTKAVTETNEALSFAKLKQDTLETINKAETSLPQAYIQTFHGFTNKLLGHLAFEAQRSFTKRSLNASENKRLLGKTVKEYLQKTFVCQQDLETSPEKQDAKAMAAGSLLSKYASYILWVRPKLQKGAHRQSGKKLFEQVMEALQERSELLLRPLVTKLPTLETVLSLEENYTLAREKLRLDLENILSKSKEFNLLREESQATPTGNKAKLYKVLLFLFRLFRLELDTQTEVAKLQEQLQTFSNKSFFEYMEKPGLNEKQLKVFPALVESIPEFTKQASELGDMLKQVLYFALREASEYLKTELPYLQERENFESYEDIIRAFIALSKSENIALSKSEKSSPAAPSKLALTKLQDRFSHRFKAFMIDEVQDANVKLLKPFQTLLKDMDFIFYIGDPKQSIFSFQGADIRSYKQLKRGISSEGQLQYLSSNYRSKQGLVHALNFFYEKSPHPFADSPDSKDGEDSLQYQKMHAASQEKTTAAKSNSPGCLEQEGFFFLHAWQVPQKFRDKKLSKEVQHQILQQALYLSLKERLAKAGENNTQAGSKNILESINKAQAKLLQGTAILVRTNKEAKELKNFLVGRGIAAKLLFSPENSIFQSKLASDLYSLLKAIFLHSPSRYPSQINSAKHRESALRLAMDGCFFSASSQPLLSTSPEWNSSTYAPYFAKLAAIWQKDGLFAMLLSLEISSEPVSLKTSKKPAPPSFSLAQHFLSSLSSASQQNDDDEDLVGVGQLQEMMEEFFKLRDLLSQYEEAIPYSQEQKATWLLSYLQEKIHAAILDALNNKSPQDGEEREPPNFYHPPAVSILTIFKSKGLEFDDVYIPYFANNKEGAGLPSSKNLSVKPNEEAGGFTLDLLPSSAELSSQDAKNSQLISQEQRRLFYVALTRAKNNLHLFAISHEFEASVLGKFLGASSWKDIYGLASKQGSAGPSPSLILEIKELKNDSEIKDFLQPVPLQAAAQHAQNITQNIARDRAGNFFPKFQEASLQFEGKPLGYVTSFSALKNSFKTPKSLSEAAGNSSNKNSTGQDGLVKRKQKEAPSKNSALQAAPSSNLFISSEAEDLAADFDDLPQAPLRNNLDDLKTSLSENSELSQSNNFAFLKNFAGLEELDFASIKDLMFGLPQGAGTGQFFHALLENIDFKAHDTLGWEEQSEHTKKTLARFFLSPNLLAPVLAFLKLLFHSKLLPSYQGQEAKSSNLNFNNKQASQYYAYALSELHATKRFFEMEFLMPLACSEEQLQAALLRKRSEWQGASLLEAFLNPPSLDLDLDSSALRKEKLKSFEKLESFESAAAIAPALSPAKNAVKGFMKGFIDLFFEHQGRYYLLDWKSNFLGDTPSAYEQSNLVSVIHEENYTLQYALYTLALHRHLQQRLGKSYGYEKHFGGVYYVFLRGLIFGKGIFYRRPPLAVVSELSATLSKPYLYLGY